MAAARSKNRKAKSTARSSLGKKIHRVTISLPAELHDDLDTLVASRQLSSRSQAICEMIREQLVVDSALLGREILMGTIQIVYDQSVPSLRSRLAKIQRDHIAEVISSTHVLLEQDAALEIILVQGPAKKLRAIADRMISCRGVLNGHLHLTTNLLPPLHGRSRRRP